MKMIACRCRFCRRQEKEIVMKTQETWKKALHIVLQVLLVLTTLVYPLFMDLLSAAGWQHNVNAGNYPSLFGAYAAWMTIGALLLTAGTVLCLIGKSCRFWQCNIAALVCAALGIIPCMTVLYQVMAYADQNFPGMRETMAPVSAMYRDRILPTLLPFLLICGLSVWQMCSYECGVYRRQKREERRRKDAEEAPRILSDVPERKA